MASGWTRSLQRVEDVYVVVDLQPADPAYAEGIYLHAGTSNIGELPRGECPQEDRVSLLAEYADRHFPGELDGMTLTMRIDSDVIRGVRDDLDIISRALRAHLAGVGVERMC